MTNKFTKFLSIATVTSATLACASFFSHAYAMAPFQASYQFSYNNKNLGSATRTLSQQGNNWTYKFVAKAGGIASASETSQFAFSDNKITSQKFSRTSKILVHNNTMNINFNPSAKVINTQKDDKKRSFAWQAGVLDELNAELQVREDLKTAIPYNHVIIFRMRKVSMSDVLLNKVLKVLKPVMEHLIRSKSYYNTANLNEIPYFG
jgi:hypothetical protein